MRNFFLFTILTLQVVLGYYIFIPYIWPHDAFYISTAIFALLPITLFIVYKDRSFQQIISVSFMTMGIVGTLLGFNEVVKLLPDLEAAKPGLFYAVHTTILGIIASRTVDWFHKLGGKHEEDIDGIV